MVRACVSGYEADEKNPVTFIVTTQIVSDTVADDFFNCLSASYHLIRFFLNHPITATIFL